MGHHYVWHTAPWWGWICAIARFPWQRIQVKEGCDPGLGAQKCDEEEHDIHHKPTHNLHSTRGTMTDLEVQY